MIECPVCNGLSALEKRCSVCGLPLTDKGMVRDFMAPYAPYMESGSATNCLHLLHCDGCGADLRYPVALRSQEA